VYLGSTACNHKNKTVYPKQLAFGNSILHPYITIDWGYVSSFYWKAI